MTILTGAEICRQRARGTIRIEPFDERRLNPNSYNFTLGERLCVYTGQTLDARVANPTREIRIPAEGLVLEAGQLYLAETAEVLGGNTFAPTFSARSSVARLGLSIHLSSGLGDIGYEGQWTLQLLPTAPVRVYPGMEIGQMMWWAPTGTITGYHGKYQGSRGPRASECWRTLDRDIARTRFPGPDTAHLDPAQVGDKAATLAQLSRAAAVPDFLTVPVAEFVDTVPAATLDRIDTVFTDLRATVGSTLATDAAQITALLADVALRPRTQDLLSLRLQEMFAPSTRFAVRSSAIGEDRAGASHAGVFDSLLGIAAGDVPAAVAAVWRSYYSLPALTMRLRAGDLAPTPRMGVIIQAMIEPDLAGIAMTGLDSDAPDRIQIEAVRGRGDALAAGIATPELPGTLPQAVAEAVRALIDVARAHLRCPAVDIEWAYAADTVYLLQARPNPAAPTAIRRTEPAVVPLYDAAIPSDMALGPIAATCAHFVTKRARAARIATQLGITRGAAYVLYLPAAIDFGTMVAPVLDPELSNRQVIVDAGDFERQLFTHYTDLPAQLERLRIATPAAQPLAVLVREYVTGVRGIITRRDEATGGFYAETSPQGLLAMNRGTATCRHITFTTDTTLDEVTELFGGTTNLTQMMAFTDQLERLTGPVAVEWILDDAGALYYIDHTVFGADHGQAFALAAAEAMMLSPGRCVGRVLRVEQDTVLERLSVAPAVSVSGGVDVSGHRTVAELVARARAIHGDGEQVILSARHPYAILAALIGHVDGFVFDSGSRLCHLGIILRENTIPAAVHPARDGELIMLDDGLVYCLTMPKQEQS
ncbi:PEP/pyruvate-binding domain-containing protein [Nocardia sp. NPDC052001]|uniref:dCTP deaminase domain-containing protein n=1 Tax=Nocardia sp. NPDC052001 TaxID=3154853 RepID=UPI0034418AF2